MQVRVLIKHCLIRMIILINASCVLMKLCLIRMIVLLNMLFQDANLNNMLHFVTYGFLLCVALQINALRLSGTKTSTGGPQLQAS